MDDDKRARIIAARQRLRERFQERMASTPGVADDAPQGSGPINRHGMPRVPVEQTVVEKWPVLDLGQHPTVPKERWKLVVDGACAAPFSLDWDDFMALPQVEDVSDFHCVTTWSKLDIAWAGVRLADVIALAEPSEGAEAILCYAHDGYTTNILLEEALKPDVLLVHTADGAPLSREHGGPVRVITPQLYAWKGAKWVRRIEIMNEDRPGFWEQNGYSMSAHPWRNDRYS